MPILNVNVNQAGQAGVFPAIIYILTNDTLSQVTQTGYLNGMVDQNIPLSDADIALVTTKTSLIAKTTQVGWFAVSHVGVNWSLVATTSSGGVILPTTPNHIGTYTNMIGDLSQDAPTAINGGNIQAGLSGIAGSLSSFPATILRGSLVLSASANSGNFVTTITNATQSGNRTFTIPDGGQVASNFILSDSTGTQNINTGSLSVSNGNISVGSNGAAGNVVIFPNTMNTGSLKIVATPNSGNNQITITNANSAGSRTFTIPDGGQVASNFILSDSTGTQTINTGSLSLSNGNIGTLQGTVFAGSNGLAGNFSVYPSTSNTGFLQIVATPNSGNNQITITNANSAGSRTFTIPDGGQTASNFILSDSTGIQTINTGSLSLSNGNIGTLQGTVFAGSNGLAGNFSVYPSTPNTGFLQIVATPNSGNNPITITNAPMGQATIINIPDPGVTNSNFILSNSSGIQQISTGSLQIAAGNLSVGSALGTAGRVISYPSSASNGSLIFAASNAGVNFNTTITNSTMGQSSIISIPDPGVTNSNFILSNSSGTQQISTGSLQIAAGNLSVGSALGTAGTLISYPSSVSNGSLIVAASNAGANFNTTITNAPMGQSSTITIRDPGTSNTNFILSNSPVLQQISTGSLQISSGNLSAGTLGGPGGTLISFAPSSGAFFISASNSPGNFNTILTNAAMGQTTTYTIPDIGASTGSIVISPLASMRTKTASQVVGGSGSVRTVTDAFCNTGSIVIGNFGPQTMPVFVFQLVPRNGSFQIVCNNDPGPSTFFYNITN